MYLYTVYFKILWRGIAASFKVKQEECFWVIEDKKVIHITLEKVWATTYYDLLRTTTATLYEIGIDYFYKLLLQSYKIPESFETRFERFKPITDVDDEYEWKPFHIMVVCSYFSSICFNFRWSLFKNIDSGHARFKLLHIRQIIERLIAIAVNCR